MTHTEIKRDAKLKAEKLISDFMPHVYYNDHISSLMNRNLQRLQNAKHCALIAVDLLIEEEMMWQNGEVEPTQFWRAVKNELENLDAPESNFEKAAEICETCGEQKVTTVWREQCSAAMCDICFNHYEHAQEGGSDGNL